MSGRRTIEPQGHSKPIGRYSPAVIRPLDGYAEIVGISGQVAVDADGVVLCPDDPGGQAEIVFGRIAALLEQAGGSIADLVSVTIFLSDRGHFAAFNAVRNRYFADHAPASTLVIAQLMEAGCLIEVNGLAVVSPALPDDAQA